MIQTGAKNGPAKPRIRITAPTFLRRAHHTDSQEHSATPESAKQRPSCLGTNPEFRASNSSLNLNVYLGSYNKGTRTPRNSRKGSKDVTPGSGIQSARRSISHLQLQHLLSAVETETNSFDIDESRDGFFDATFFRPTKPDVDRMIDQARDALPASFRKLDHFSFHESLWAEWRSFRNIAKQIVTTRSGMKLLKSFLGFFIAYVICVVPASGEWLGKYNYILVVSSIINHPGRKIGSQIDGAVLTILGTAVGLGWGSLALYVSTSTAPARVGYGGILAIFLILFTWILAWLRCVYIRFYQAILCAGFAVCYACLANTSEVLSWNKMSAYGVPWVLGQALNLVVCSCIFPAAGTRQIYTSLHASFETILSGLSFASPTAKQRLAKSFVDLSEAVRDFTLDISFSSYDPEDVRLLRNLIQATIRGTLAVREHTVLFDNLEAVDNAVISHEDSMSSPAQLVRKMLGVPTSLMLTAMKSSIRLVDMALMELSGHLTYRGPSNGMLPNLVLINDELRSRTTDFNAADSTLITHPDLPTNYGDDPRTVELLLFVHPLRQLADRIQALLQKVIQMQEGPCKRKLRLPSYAIEKALLRTNAQVRHDRGGLAAGFFFHTQGELDKAMRDLQSTAFVPSDQKGGERHLFLTQTRGSGALTSLEHDPPKDDGETVRLSHFRHELWVMFHRLQGFESRFALKVTLATSLISIPAWLQSSNGWWNHYESWWAVATIWLMMHPRVGGNLQDLVVRSSSAVLGVFWGGLSYRAGSGNPYIMATFATLFMIPMLYRFTQSSHPRSGAVGCVAFVVVSLSVYTNKGLPTIVDIASTRGIAFVVGIVSGVFLNIVLWPFNARHELRKSLSTMMLHSAVIYRGVVSQYIYYTDGHEPNADDVEKSEMLESRLREGFVRIRQLMELTRHEMRLRGPFNPLPHSGLICACEKLFEHLVQVRQSSLYFQRDLLAGSENAAEALLTYRRDAVAVILMNLYTLAGALRSGNPIPRYLPSAAAARRRLLDKMDEAEVEQARRQLVAKDPHRRRWADIYHYAYSSALTDIVENLEELTFFTKEIVGEVGWGSESVG